MVLRYLIICLVGLGSLTISCRENTCEKASGPRYSELRYVENIESVLLSTPADLSIRKDSIVNSTIEVTSQEEVAPSVDLEITRGLLFISLSSCFKEHAPILLNSTVKALDQVYLLSAGLIQSSELIIQDTITLVNSGLGDIDLALNSKLIEAEIESSGNILLSGDAHEVRIRTEGSGELEAFTLYADSVVINNLGSSVLQVYARDYLEINFFQSTTVEYRGQPTIKTLGSGNVVDANL